MQMELNGRDIESIFGLDIEGLLDLRKNLRLLNINIKDVSMMLTTDTKFLGAKLISENKTLKATIKDLVQKMDSVIFDFKDIKDDI